MKYSLACGFAALALGGCVNNNPFYVDPTGASSSTSDDPTMTAGDSSTSIPTTWSTGDPDTDDPNTSVGTSVSTGTSSTSSTSSTSEESSGAVTMDTGDDTGNTTMPAAFCGDGELNPGELCDDGNDNDDDECTVACLPPPSLEGLFPAGVSELLGYPEQNQAPGLCPGLMMGISIVGGAEIGIVRVKLLCQDFKFVSVGDGAFEIEPVGPISYGEYIGSDAPLDKNWVPQCPTEAPALVGFGGWATETELTSLELQCVKLVLVPDGDDYKLIYENLQTQAGGYNDWGLEQPHVGCGELPGTFAADVIVHTSANGVSGLEVLCSEPDLGL